MCLTPAPLATADAVGSLTLTTPASSVAMSPAVTLAVLAGALLHATWNAIAHGISDRLVGFTLIGLAQTVASAVVVLVTGLPTPAAWPFILASAGVHVVYQVMLMASYQLGQFSQVYPLARGTAPLVVTVVSIALLDQRLPPTQLVGVLVVSSGLISLVFLGGWPTRARLPALVAAIGTGLLIATYTLIDATGVRTTNVIGYTAWMFLLFGPVVPMVALAIRGRKLVPQLRPSLLTGLGGGVVSLAAYAVVLWALTRGVAAPIAALRETSIIFGALIGAVFFHERLGRGRALASVLVVAGIILINLA
jgi:drug/metabolite transporter (DMT)-like permease